MATAKQLGPIFAMLQQNPALREQVRHEFVTSKGLELAAAPESAAITITYEAVSRAVDACARKGCAAYDLQSVPLVCRRCVHWR